MTKGIIVPSQSRRVLLLVLLAATTLPSGCGNSKTDPVAASWKKIKVEYCVGSPPMVTMKSWETEDRKLLEDLRGALKIKSRQALSLVPTMTTNRIALTLADGKDIVMYIYDEERLSFYNVADRRQSCSITTDRGFVEKLKNVIRDAADEPIHFYYDREVTISRQLAGR